MSASNTRRRLSLLTGGSLAAALAMAGAGGMSLTPAVALAANECGDPNTNGASSDTFVCAGTFSAITYPATNGTLTLQLQNNVTTTTGGLVVAPTGTNTVSITRASDVPANAGDPSLTSTGGAGLQVTRATGGTISVNLSDNDTGDTPMTISGTTAGVRLQNAEASSTSLVTTNGAISASAGAGVEMGTSGTGTLTLTNGASVTGTTAAVLVTAGVNATITNSTAGVLNGAVTLNNTGASTFTNNGTWNAAGISTLGAGVSTLTNSTTGTLSITGAATIDFGAGADVFTNTGTVTVGAGTEGPSTLTLAGLETWNNAGSVVFGFDAATGNSDGVANDRVVAAGALFTGYAVSPDIFAGTDANFSNLVMDVDLAADQDDCSAAVSADCLDLRGGTTTGSTDIIVNSIGGQMAMADRIVLVDVGGAGTSAASHFTLSEFSSGYRLIGAARTIDSGLFFYTLQYDATAKQHVLAASAINGNALPLTRIGRAASEPWRTATGMWHERQADLRSTLANRSEGSAPGVWLKVAGNFINEVSYDTVDVGAGQAEYNLSYAQRTTAVVGGVDLVRMTGEASALVLGLTAAKLDSTLDYTDAASELELDGRSFGAYATLVAGRLFVDGIVNSANMDLTHTGLGQVFEGSAKSIGYQAEGGWRLFEINDTGAFVEPIAALSYVKTDVDDIAIGPVATTFAEATSLRGALGVRVAGDMVTDVLTATFSFTGRLWNEFDAENETTFGASFGDTTLIDAAPDTLGDVGLAVSLFTLGNRLSANLGYGVKFKDDYQSTDASVSLRYSW